MGEVASKIDLRQCIYCGKSIRRGVRQCPYCREAQNEAPSSVTARVRSQGYQFRTGLLLILMATVAHYFVGGYSPLTLPYEVVFPLATYLIPLLFAAGIAMTLYGVFLRLRA